MKLIPSTQIFPHQNNLHESELIKIKVKLFAIYQENFGQPELELAIPPQTPVIKVLEALLAEKPELQQWLKFTRFGINWQFVQPDTLLKDRDEVVFIPPVSGG
jgi:molybdopterin synthase sulfur carrier subunit